MRRHVQKRREVKVDFVTRLPLYTQVLLHTDAFTHRRFYAQMPLHTHRDTFTQMPLHTSTCTHSHTEALYT